MYGSPRRGLSPFMLCRRDDLTRTQLRAQLAELRPCELVLPSAPLSEASHKVLKAALRSPRTSRYHAADSAASVVAMLEERGYFAQWPEVLKVGPGAHPCLLAKSFLSIIPFQGRWRTGTIATADMGHAHHAGLSG